MKELVCYCFSLYYRYRFSFYCLLTSNCSWLLTVDLREVKEVRPGKNSRDFDRWPDDAKKFQENQTYVVFYGQEFRLKTLSIGGLYHTR